MSRHFTHLAVVALGIALAACSSDSTAPAPVAPTLPGTYVLHTANGAPAPVYLYSFSDVEFPADSGSVYIVGDTLSLTESGAYDQSAWFEARQGSRIVGRARWVDHGVWTREGSTVHFDSNYIENVLFEATFTTQGQLTTSRDILGEGGPVSYVLRKI